MSFHFTIVRNRLNHPLAQKTDFASYYSVTIVRRSIIVRGLVKGRRRSRETLMEETLLDFAGSCFFFLGGGRENYVSFGSLILVREKV